MRILVVGLGVIGTTYGYVFQASGHTVEHFIRENKQADAPSRLTVKLFDGRYNGKGEAKQAEYSLAFAQPDNSYDFIVISVSAGKLAAAIQTLNEHNLQGTIIVLNGIWEEKSVVDQWFGHRPYILGYPVAGGSIEHGVLDSVLFGHLMLESQEKANIANYADLMALLSSCHLKTEVPYDMLAWIWIHMAINAGVITTAAKYGDVFDPARAAQTVMTSSKALMESVLTIREAIRIIEARGVSFRHYRKDLLPYTIPPRIAGWLMKRMFANNELTRRIMQLHSNVDDLIYVCKSVYDCGKEHGIPAPLLYPKYEHFAAQLRK
ncbi:ketopantoate reductase family protein [Paenibacillus sp. 598K]|uniref:ketopantoate reductase family protein n=1 Tax=Paenibacillus sp. 598K TaxID=1117987 RepID=UPI000FFE45CD|nr:2-dehydropantoate 2-reductase N-terminal domain-containing protein [Paenibacillus sp. 598K]